MKRAHITSIDTRDESYKDLVSDPVRLGKRQLEVLKAIAVQPRCSEMIAKAVNLPINCITGRIAELRDDYQYVMDYGWEFGVHGKKVMVWGLTEAGKRCISRL